MIYLRSFLAGLGIFMLAVILCFAFNQFYFVHWRAPALMSGSVRSVNKAVHNSEPGFEMKGEFEDAPIVLQPMIWGLVAFAGGFYWMYRRTLARTSNPNQQ